VPFNINDSSSRLEAITCVLLNEAFPHTDRLDLYKLMHQSEMFFEFMPYCVQDEFLSPESLAATGVLKYGFHPDAVARVMDGRAAFRVELELRKKTFTSQRLIEIAQGADGKTTADMRAQIDEVASTLQVRSTRGHMVSGDEAYQKIIDKPLGILTGAKSLDDVLSGLMYGTMAVVFGFVSAGKSTFLLNCMYQAITRGFNVCFMTLEVTRELMHHQLLSLHSFRAAEKLKGDPVPYLDIIKGKLNDKQREYIFGTVESDLNGQSGKFTFAEIDDVEDFSYAGLKSYLDSLPFFSDVVVLDYAQKLLPYLKGGRDPNMVQARMVSDFTHLAVGTGKEDARIVLMGAQANREGHKEAEEAKGMYNIRAIANINSLERDAYYCISLFTDDDLRRSQETKICLLKNKSGPLIPEPVVVPFDPRFYAIGNDIQGYEANVTASDLGSIMGGSFDLGAMLGGTG